MKWLLPQESGIAVKVLSDGEAVVEMPDGARWLAIGHSSRGTAEILRQYGYIQFIPIHGPLPYRKIRAISPVVESDNALEGDEILVDGLKIIALWKPA